MKPSNRGMGRKVKNLILGILTGFLLGRFTLERDLFGTKEDWLALGSEVISRVDINLHDKKQLTRLMRSPQEPIGTTLSFDSLYKTLKSEPVVPLTVAEKLQSEIRILCWVLTAPKNHRKRALHVKNTWGKHCNILLFMSTEKDPSINSIPLNIQEDRKHLWGKTKFALKYIYENYLDKADWFIKADDDTFVIVENLRYFLRNQSTSSPIYFGCRFKPYLVSGYMSGGAGYVMSRKAVQLFGEIALVAPLGRLCQKDAITGTEDVQLGRCLQAVGVKAGDSIDIGGQFRFNPFTPDYHLTRSIRKETWFERFTWWPQPLGLECCSDSAITFHYIRPADMHVMEYLVYRLRHDGIGESDKSQNT